MNEKLGYHGASVLHAIRHLSESIGDWCAINYKSIGAMTFLSSDEIIVEIKCLEIRGLIETNPSKNDKLFFCKLIEG